MSQSDEGRDGGLEAVQAQQGGDSDKLVPVSESIRYRKRAQAAEAVRADLERQLGEARFASEQLSVELSAVKADRELSRKLSAAGAVDVEAAVLLAKDRLSGGDADVDAVVHQLREEKEYLFGGSVGKLPKGSPVKDRHGGSRASLERACKRAASSGSRADMQEYLRLRRGVS